MDTIDLTPTTLISDGIASLDTLIISTHPSLLSVSLPALATATNLQIANNPVLNSVSLPALKAHNGTSLFSLIISGNPLLTTLDLNSLNFSSGSVSLNTNPVLSVLPLGALIAVNRSFSLEFCSALTTLSLPSLISVQLASGPGFLARNCTSLSTVTFPKYLPTPGKAQNFQNCALSQTSVDHILARCVANANYVSGTVNLSGGTSSTPGAQGQLDKATLIARGCTVLTN